jgi:hypothetical protein
MKNKMKKAIYKKNVSGYLNIDLKPIHKEVECVSTNIFDVDRNWEKFDDEQWLNHNDIESEIEIAVKSILEKHGVGVNEIKFVIDEDLDDSWDI